MTRRCSHSFAEAGLVIGLVNIMPAPAMRTTETLFRTLLDGFAPRHNVQLRLFAPDAPGRTNEIYNTGQHYESLDGLWDASDGRPAVDALIVTGTESQASLMEDEPSWPHLQKICDWAAEHTISTIWSCFSAHAAVLHIDGIRRRRMDEKLSGVFQCRKVSEHFMPENLPEEFPVPHSRYNGLSEAELRARHYEILSQSARVGVDSFTKKHGKSQFLFLQGHPEYAPQILLSEYCRDVRRFMAGERGQYPNLPENYFDIDTIEAFIALRERDKSMADNPFPPEFVDSVLAKLDHHWRGPAQQLYAAWLSHIADQKFHNWTHQLAYKNETEAA